MDNGSGYITIPREVLSLPFWEDPWDTALWLYCALHVTYRPYGSTKPGQFISSKSKIADDLHWSRNAVIKHLASLQYRSCLTAESVGYGTCITLSHWNLLCGNSGDHNPLSDCIPLFDTKSSLSARKTPVQLVQNAAQKMNSPVQNPRNDCSCGEHKQEEIIEKKNTLSLMRSVRERERDFQIFWRSYPRHENESGAKKAFMLLDVPLDKLLEALSNAMHSSQWLVSNGRFIPMASKWLNGTWKDFLPAEIPDEPVTDDSLINKERAAWKRY